MLKGKNQLFISSPTSVLRTLILRHKDLAHGETDTLSFVLRNINQMPRAANANLSLLLCTFRPYVTGSTYFFKRFY